MQTLKTAVLVACVMGIITTICQISIPEKFKGQMRLLLTLVTILSVASLFVKGGINVDFDKFSRSYSEDSAYLMMNQALSEDVTLMTEEILRTRICQELKAQQFDFESVVINCEADEYNCIRLVSVQVVTNAAESAEQITAKICELVGSDAEISVVSN